MIAREEFVSRLAVAIYNGRRKTPWPIATAEALMRAVQVADALPALFREDEICLLE